MRKINIILLLGIIVVFVFSFKACGEQKYNFCLKKSYEYYKNAFMTKDGRIMDPEKNNISTSESQSYIMLRSLAVGDKKTFDLTYKWTKNNLQRKDKLFHWLWGENSKGEYKTLDENSASDADVDIAFALFSAYETWSDSQYLNEALPIIKSIWNNETKQIGQYRVLMPGVKQTISDKIEINPSYFAPYAFRLFQKYDNVNDWNCLINSSYYYLTEVISKTKTGLPPNWFLIGDEHNGGQNSEQIVLEGSPRSDFSYDAIRVFWRIYLDYEKTGEKRALPILEKSKFFVDKWGVNDGQNQKCYVNYQANGQLKDKDEFVGSIAVLLPVISMYDKEFAAKIYENKVQPYQNEKYWKPKKDYYAKNLLWFGCYLYANSSN